jgi:hypothetical protein
LNRHFPVATPFRKPLIFIDHTFNNVNWIGF